MPTADSTVTDWKDRAKAEAEAELLEELEASAAAAQRQKQELERKLLHALESLSVLRGVAANPLISVTLTEDEDDYAETVIDGVRFRWTQPYRDTRSFLSVVGTCYSHDGPVLSAQIEDTLSLGRALLALEHGTAQCGRCWREEHSQAPEGPSSVERSLEGITRALEGICNILDEPGSRFRK